MIGKKLVVISHTLHVKTKERTIVGWGPTVNEINFLADYWDEVVHVGCLGKDEGNSSLVPYSRANITFIAIPEFGGVRLIDKLNVFTQSFRILKTIKQTLQGASHVQIRVPMGIGIYVLPYFLILPRKFYLWVKYANNWQYVSKSMGYRFQRWFLKRNYLNCPVTINGKWSQQDSHLKSFENPCITQEQFKQGQEVIKDFSGQFTIVIAGRLESAKGMDLLLEIVDQLPKQRIYKFIFLGDGPLKNQLIAAFKQAEINAEFCGFVNQETVHLNLQKAHFLLLPSKSEGFPKVIAEAWNYACIPISTAVGSIPHYVKNEFNGFILDNISSSSILNTISAALKLDNNELNQISNKGKKESFKFTFDYYLSHLKEEVLL